MVLKNASSLQKLLPKTAGLFRRRSHVAPLYSQGIFTYPLASSSDKHPPKTLYDHPELYEACFSFRDIKKEVEFIREVYKRHAGVGLAKQGHVLESVLELGSGTGSHARALSRAGVHRVTGLDMCDEMLTYAIWKSKSEGIDVGAGSGSGSGSLDFIKGDMESFEIKDQVDMVLCLLGTFSHCLSNEAANRAMACISRALRPGGIFLLELGHPGDLFDGKLEASRSFVVGDCGKDMWEVAINLPDGSPSPYKILVEWGAEFDVFSSVSQVVSRTIAVTTFQGEQVIGSMEEVLAQRQFTVQELKLLGDINGLTLDTNLLYGEMDLEVGLTHEDAYRMVAVFRKDATTHLQAAVPSVGTTTLPSGSITSLSAPTGASHS